MMIDDDDDDIDDDHNDHDHDHDIVLYLLHASHKFVRVPVPPAEATVSPRHDVCLDK